jgi:hypothetical protein
MPDALFVVTLAAKAVVGIKTTNRDKQKRNGTNRNREIMRTIGSPLSFGRQ